MAISLNTIGIFTTVGALVITLRYVLRKRIPEGLKLPPGPPRNFIIGNLRDVPSHHEWETYSEWHKKYGDLVYLDIMGTSVLCVNTAEMANELFDKRAAIYSDRPSSPMIDLIGVDWMFALMNYGERWRRYRQDFHKEFSIAVPIKYPPIQVKHTQNLLKQLYKSSDNWRLVSRDSIGAIIMEIAYGIEVKAENDPYVAMAEFLVELVANVSTPGAYLVNAIPQLRYLPEWFPGAGFKRKAKIWRKRVKDVYTVPYQSVKKELEAGIAKQSLTTTLLEAAYTNGEDQKISEAEEERISSLAGVLYAAGADTSVATLEQFVFAMILFPHVQVEAQKELDAVIGPDRFPTFDDRSNLPYVNALCKEVVRWHPLAPTGFPHRLMKDDIVGEYFIPEGTIILGNAWDILHSEATYGPDPMNFKPERFLNNPDMPAPTVAFGFGRRACPGRIMAENGLFIAAASILHVFNIVTPPGERPPDKNAFVPGLISRPEPFKCNFVPRSAAAEALIKHIE